jgi:eukaryotic-like serine/threonine-protein kinase
MTLRAGTHLGTYEIISLIGSGGMGEVYRAHDPAIGRDVAIKVLPSFYTQNSERLQRFEFEARSAGSLNHPNIIIVHALGNHQGYPYLVSELLDGKTLREHLNEGISQKGAINFARQIVTGLAAAHDKGIIHRDLKPENIFVTRDGRVKLLDFGLAKLTETNESDEVSHLPTSPQPTGPGVVLGTVGYMSPEQVRGKAADSRSDIFSFGVVLFEMLSSKSAFRQESAVETMNAILKEDPIPILQTDQFNPALVRIVQHCLEKNPTARFQSAHDLAFALDSLGTFTNISQISNISKPTASFLRYCVLSVLVALATLAGILFLNNKKQNISNDVIVSTILPPPGVLSAFISGFALSPDGKTLAFSALSNEGKRQIWLRHLKSEDAYPITGTDRASYPFWSPDGRNIAFFAGGYLKRVSVSGGPVHTLCRTALIGKGGAWSSEGFIVFAGERNGILQRVAEDGGEPINLFAGKQLNGLAWPTFSNDAKYLIYASRLIEDQTYVVDLNKLSISEKIQSLRGGHVEFGSPSQILYVKDRILQAQTINAKSGTLSGKPVAIAERVASPVDWESFSVSRQGTLVLSSTNTAESLTSSQLMWVDRSGSLLSKIPLPGSIWTVRISHDGKRVAYNRGDHVWMYDTEGGEPIPVTVGESYFHWPVWSPDDSRIVIHKTEPYRDVYRLMERSVAGSTTEEQLLVNDPQHYSSIVSDWSSDGRLLLVSNNFGNADIQIFDHVEKTFRPLLSTQANEMNAVFSPDEKWIAYQSDETGDFEVYIRPLIGSSSRRLSSGGGAHPHWRADGKELFYMKPDGSMMSIDFQLNPTLQAKPAKFLFKMLMADIIQGTACPYDVSPDGQRFLIIVPLSGPPSLTLIQNWPALMQH